MMVITTRFVHVQTRYSVDTIKNKHAKADGSPDRRFRENRKIKPVVVPTNKDGTSDMQYKAVKMDK